MSINIDFTPEMSRKSIDCSKEKIRTRGDQRKNLLKRKLPFFLAHPVFNEHEGGQSEVNKVFTYFNT